MEITIRPAQMTDVPGIAAVLRSIDYFTRFAEMAEADLLAQVERALVADQNTPDHQVWVAVDVSGQVLGYTAVHWLPYLILRAPEGYVSELFVHAQARGMGIGKSLLAEVKAEGKKRGCQRLSLLNGRQRESYERRFYAKDGWTERDTMVNFLFEIEEKR